MGRELKDPCYESLVSIKGKMAKCFIRQSESKVILAFWLADFLNREISFFQTGELLTFRKPQSSTKILSIIGDSDFQFSSHRAILIYVSKES